MTVRLVLRALLRRWYVSLAILLIAAAGALWMLQDGGSYSSRTVISFTYPEKTSLASGNGTSDLSVIAFAGAVASEVNRGKPVNRYSDDSAPYYGAGVRQGVLVGLTAAGNQWATSYPRADIELQIVGRTREWVEATQDALVAQVLQVSDAQQSGLADTAALRISATVVPLTTNIEYIAPSRSQIIAAGAAILLAALIVAIWGAAATDDLLRRRRGPVRTMRGAAPILKESPS